MAKKAHVPKFGNWDGDNVPYTSYFENAHRGKGTTGKAFNPNDPEENPDAFLSGIFPSEPEVRKSKENIPSDHRNVIPPQQEGRKPRVSSSNHYRTEGRKSRGDSSSNGYRIVNNSEYQGRKSRDGSSSDYRAEGRKSRDTGSNNYRVVNNSEYEGRHSRDGTSSDYRAEQQRRKSRGDSSSKDYRVANDSEYEGRKSRESSSNDHHRTVRRQQNKYVSKDDTESAQGYMDTSPPRGKSHQNGNSAYRSNRSPESTPERYRASSKQTEKSSFSMWSPSPRRSVLKSGRRGDAMVDTPSSVPRFEASDDKNPDSGDGFTMIFNKAKHEKKTAQAKAPRVPPAAPKIHPSLRSSSAKPSSKSKVTCCLFPRARD